MIDPHPRPAVTPRDPAMPSWRLGRAQGVVFIVLLGLAFPWASFEGFGVLVAVVVAALGTIALNWALSRRLLLVAALGIQFLLVYVPGVGDGVVLGVTRVRLTASSESVLEAVAFLALFLTLLGLVAAATRAWLDRLARARERTPAEDRLLVRKAVIGVAALLLMTMVAAFLAGRWSYYHDRAEAGAQASGGIRLELFYESALFLAITFGLIGRAYSNRAPTEPTTQAARTTRFGIAAGLVLLLFILQSRRVMLICAAITGLVWLAESRRTQAAARALRRRLALLAAMLLIMIVGSTAWRAGGDSETPTLSGRFERVFTDFGGSDISQTIDDRLTYLWFDAISRDLEGVRNSPLNVGDLFLSSMARVVPRVVWSDKDSVPDMSCETAFAALGIESDLPCTPQTEGWLAGGLLGLFIAALGWGFTLGIAEVLVARGPGLAAVFGLLLFFPMPILENGIFTWVQSLRLALIGTGIVAFVGFWASLVIRAKIPKLHGKASIGLPTRSNR